MTANQMKYQGLVLYDKLAGFGAPGYNDQEWSKLFTISQENFVKSHYTPKGNKYQQGFENSEKRRKDLGECLRYDENTIISTSQVGVHMNGTYYDLPHDFWLAVEEEIESNIDETTCTIIPPSGYSMVVRPLWRRMKIRPITYDEYNAQIKNPFKNPYDKLVWRMDFSREQVNTNPKRHELITDGTYLIKKYLVWYIKKLSDIVVDETTPVNQVNCELDETTHSEIVAEAVRIATGITNLEEYQVKTVEQLKSE